MRIFDLPAVLVPETILIQREVRLVMLGPGQPEETITELMKTDREK
jgi:hypothetical protein